jgi:hypothetical protein
MKQLIIPTNRLTISFGAKWYPWMTAGKDALEPFFDHVRSSVPQYTIKAHVFDEAEFYKYTLIETTPNQKQNTNYGVQRRWRFSLQ